MAKKKARPLESPVRRRPAKLEAYLREIQAQYRQPNVPFPKTVPELAQEAEGNIFNAQHIVAILVGWAGPWLDQKGLELKASLFLARNQLQKLRNPKLRESLRKDREARVIHNRRVGRAKSAAKAFSYRKTTSLGRILKVLDGQILPLHPLVARDARLGITRNPELPETRQAFWAPVADQLMRYLDRSCGRTSELVRSDMTARILHLASGGAFPCGASGAARVKQLAYRSPS